MSDLRYLALSLIGVFLALAVGLLLGFSLNSPDRRDRYYERLRTDFDGLRADDEKVRAENRLVRQRLTSRDQALREVLPLAIRGKLAGYNVGVIICGSGDEHAYWVQLEEALKLAGAQITTVVRVPERTRQIRPEVRQTLARRWDRDAATDDPVPYEAAGWAARAVIRGASNEEWDTLQRETGVEVRRSSAEPARRVLVLTSADDARGPDVGTRNLPEFRVLAVCSAEQARVVAAEPEDSPVSVVDVLPQGNLATVDNIDTPSGQIAGVLALAGADGRFGSRQGRATPPVETR